MASGGGYSLLFFYELQSHVQAVGLQTSYSMGWPAASHRARGMISVTNSCDKRIDPCYVKTSGMQTSFPKSTRPAHPTKTAAPAPSRAITVATCERALRHTSRNATVLIIVSECGHWDEELLACGKYDNYAKASTELAASFTNRPLLLE